MQNKLFIYKISFIIFFALILGLASNVQATNFVDSSIDVRYRAAITNVGWQSQAYYDGDTAGLEGKSIPLENFRAVIQAEDKNIGVEYSIYVKGVGWKNWIANGEEFGNYNKDVTGIKLKLHSTEDYIIQYRVYSNGVGWSNWAQDGEMAGYENEHFIECLQLKVLTKDLTEQDEIKVRYRVCFLSEGWQKDAYYNGDTAGTENTEYPVQAIRAVIANTPNREMGIEYTTYVKNSGWQPLSENGAAREIKGKAVTAVRLRLKNSSEKYSVKYRVCTESKGWQNWVKDYEVAGLEDDEDIIGIQIKIMEDTDYVEPVAKVRYRTYVSGKGWQDKAYYDGETGGETDSSTYLAATRMVLENVPSGAGIRYKTYIKNEGWKDWKSNGNDSNSYQSNITGIKIELQNLKDYVVSYRVYLENKGWQKWVEDGKLAGTEGDERVKAIQIKIVKKSEYVAEKDENPIKVRYRIHITNSSWADNAYYDGDTAGNAGSKNYLDAVRMVVENNSNHEGIEYATYIKQKGWTGWQGNGTDSNVLGYNITAIRIRLTNTIDYSIKYRVYLENKGWTSWEKDGYVAGTEGTTNIEAIQIKIEERGAPEVNVRYRVNIQNIGWQESAIYDGETAGNRNNNLTSMRIVLQNAPSGIGIKYRAFNQYSGWQNWAQNGAESGKTSENLQAFRIELTNTTENSVKYRAYIQNQGWTSWVSDGTICGKPGMNTNIVAIQVAILKEKHILNVSASQTISNGKYRIYSASRGKYLTATGKELSLQSGNNSRNQNFIVTYLGNGYYKIVAESSNNYLAVNGSGTADPVNVYEFGNSTAINKEWIISSIGNGNYYIVSDCNYLYLDGANESALQVTRAANAANAIFKFEKVKVELQSGTYGSSGLQIKGDSRGQNLTYYKIGNGPNVFFGTFAVHGWEDLYSYDGQALTRIAENFKDRLMSMQDEYLANKWTIYIFPSVNPDGEYYGWTKDGPGRTTLYSAAPNNKGIDINRCWSTGYTRATTDRNYNGTESFQAYEARSLRDFLLSHRATNGQTVLIDLHGWLNETIGDDGLGSYYRAQFGISKHIDTYGQGYLVNWARNNLGYNGRTARSSLVELPEYDDDSNKYINATINMLRGI